MVCRAKEGYCPCLASGPPPEAKNASGGWWACSATPTRHSPSTYFQAPTVQRCAQTVLSAALASANLSSWLGTPGAAFTVFAVTDGGWADAFARGGVLCTVAYMRSGACGSVGDLLASTGLRNTVLNYGAPHT